jgi:hypothetical protein
MSSQYSHLTQCCVYATLVPEVKLLVVDLLAFVDVMSRPVEVFQRDNV